METKYKFQGGLTLIQLIVGVLVVAIIGVGGYFAKGIFFDQKKGGQGIVVAQISFKQNVVRTKLSTDISWNEAILSQKLFEKDSVRTFPDSMAVISFVDDPTNTLIIDENSLIVIDRFQSSGEKKQFRFTLLEGEIRGQINRNTAQNKNIVLEIKTPDKLIRADTSTAINQKVSLDLKVGTDKSAQLKVLEGNASVLKEGDNPQAALILKQNQFLTLKPGAITSTPKMLPQAPALKSVGIDEFSFLEGATTGKKQLTWNSVSGVKRYRVQVSSNPEFKQPFLQDATVDKPIFRLNVDNPQTGDNYYWRVAAINDEGVEGQFSNPTQLRLAMKKPTTIRKPRRPNRKPLQLKNTKKRYTVKKPFIDFSGKVQDNHHLTINGQPVKTDTIGKFTVRYPLQQGKNTIVFETIDNQGKITYVIREVEFAP